MEIEITIPSSWNELTDKQLLGIAALKHIHGSLFDYSVWLILNNCKWYQFRKAYHLKCVMSEVGITTLKEHFSFVYKKNDRTIFPELIGYNKPMDRILNLTIEEFAVADDLNNTYLKTGDTTYLKALCAVLYKQKGEVYDHLLLNEKSKQFKACKGGFLLGVHLAWNGCKNNLVNRYTTVFPKLKVATRSNKKTGFLEVVLKMSGGKFGSHSETKRTNVYTFMTEFEESLKMQEKWQEKYPTKK